MCLNPTCAALLSFSMEKEMVRLVILPCFDLGLTVPMYTYTYVYTPTTAAKSLQLTMNHSSINHMHLDKFNAAHGRQLAACFVSFEAIIYSYKIS